MSTKEEIEEQAKYYIYNDVTMKEAGEHFGVSKKTFQNRMKTLEEINPILYEMVQLKKSKNLALGMVKGGQNGKPGTVRDLPLTHSHKYTAEQIISFAEYMLESDASLRDVEVLNGTSKATLLDNLTSDILGEELYEEVRTLLEEHKPKNGGGKK